MFTRPCPETGYCSSHPHLIYLRPILVLSSCIRLGLTGGIFPSGFPTALLYIFIIPPCVLHGKPSHPRVDHSDNIL